MRPAHNLLLATTAAIAAMALTAGSAFGQAVEVTPEDSGTHCGDVVEETGHNTSGGCEITVVSTSNPVTFDHTGVSEDVTTSCENEFIANLDENGTGYIDTSATTVHTSPPPTFSPCPIVACREAGGAFLEWPIAGGVPRGGDQGDMILSFCISTVADPAGSGSACTILIDVVQNPVTHVITLTADQEPCHENPGSEVSGTWQTTGSSEVEIFESHYPYDD